MNYYGARIATAHGFTYQTIDLNKEERDAWILRMILALVPEDPQQSHWEDTGVRIARWTHTKEGEIDK